MSWWDLIKSHLEDFGVSLFFAFGGSGFALYAWSRKAPDHHLAIRAVAVVLGGQLVAFATTAIAYGYYNTSKWMAPAIGAGCGILGFATLLLLWKIGFRAVERSDTIADAVINKGVDLLGGKTKEDR